MGLKFRGGVLGLKSTGADAPVAPVIKEKQTDAEGQQYGADKEMDQNVTPTDANDSSANSVNEKKELQFGVQAAEATLQVWTKEHLIAAYIL